MSGLTRDGFARRRLVELQAELEEGLVQAFGPEVNVDVDSVFSRVLGTTARGLAEVWELGEDVYNGRYPGSAAGAELDHVVGLVGLQRRAGGCVVAELELLGIPGAVVPAGAQVASTNTAVRFQSALPITLQSVPTVGVRLRFTALFPYTRYEITIAGTTVAETTGATVSAFPTVPLSLQLQTQAPQLGVLPPMAAPDHLLLFALDPAAPIPAWSAAVVLPQIYDIRVEALPGASHQLNINGVGLAVGGGADARVVAQRLADRIAQLGQPLVTWGPAQLQSALPSTAQAAWLRIFGTAPGQRLLNIALTVNLTGRAPSLTLVDTQRITGNTGRARLEFTCLTAGPIALPAGDIRQIATPAPGWLRARNPMPTGAPLPPESDTALRRRRWQTLVTPDASVVDAIRAQLAALAQVTQVFVLENSSHLPMQGRAPKSIEVVIEGGDDAQIVQRLWEVKPAGIATVSTLGTPLSRAVVDGAGKLHTVVITRPRPIYLWIHAELTRHPEETLPSAWESLGRQALMSQASTLGLGQDVIAGRLVAAIHRVPGIYGVSLWVMRTTSAAPAPVFSPTSWQRGNVSVLPAEKILIAPGQITLVLLP